MDFLAASFVTFGPTIIALIAVCGYNHYNNLAEHGHCQQSTINITLVTSSDTEGKKKPTETKITIKDDQDSKQDVDLNISSSTLGRNDLSASISDSESDWITSEEENVDVLGDNS